MPERPRKTAGRSPSGALAATLAATLACGWAAPTFAQQATGGQSLTLEELETYIEEQKAALEQAERNREITRDKEAKVREELARREAHRQTLEDEVRKLCEDRLAVDAADVPEECEAGPEG